MSRDPMTLYDFLLAAQLMSEERYGKVIRQHHKEQAVSEDAKRRRLLGKVTA